MKCILFLILSLVICNTMYVKPIVAVNTPQSFVLGLGALEESVNTSGTPTVTEFETQVSQYGITWTFSSSVEYGQFVNGDYFVIDDGAGITVESISPEPTGYPDTLKNGSMINPLVGQWPIVGNSGAQGLDYRAARYNSELSLQPPFTINVGDSLVSSISIDSFTTDWNNGSIDSHTDVGAASILTVLSEVPPSGSFRPAYTDRNQTLYNVNDLDKSKLPDLPMVGMLDNPLSYYERGVERPWLMWQLNADARTTHAVMNMYEYHANISQFLSDAFIIIMTDMADTETLLNGLIQIGIDSYYIGKQGIGDSAYYVPPTLFAGILLGDSNMLNLFTDGSLLSVPRDYPDFYYWEAHESTRTSIIVPEGETWQGATVFFRNGVGDGEHEHLHPSEWPDATVEKDLWRNLSYQLGVDSSIHPGMVLSALLLGHNAKTLWNHDSTFDYADRWMSKDWPSECAVIEQYDTEDYYGVDCNRELERGSSNFVNEMWDAYRNTVN